MSAQATETKVQGHSADAVADQRSLHWCVEASIEEAGVLYETLQEQLCGDTATFSDISTLCDRLDAHLDVLRIAGAQAWSLLDVQLASPSPGLMFVATVLSLEQRQSRRLKALIALAEADAMLSAALLYACGWVPATVTAPLVTPMLGASVPFYQRIGLYLCRQHQVPADTALERAITTPDRTVQLLALDVIGETGALDLLPYCQQRLTAEDCAVRFAACRASLMLGERTRSLPLLMQWATKPSPQQKAALALLTVFLPVTQAQSFLATVGRNTPDRRLLVQLAGKLGDPANIPALLRLMPDPLLGRIAGHAFSIITGADLVAFNLERSAPADVTVGPNDDPGDDNVDSDMDDALPWPDVAKVSHWWAQHCGRFVAGQRYLAGNAITVEQCLQVLQQGDQLQRHAAALHLKALNPASPLFTVDAPAWRQKARLASMIATL